MLANGTLVFVRSCCGTSRCFGFVPITITVSVCRNLGNVCLIITTSAVMRFATNCGTGRSNVFRPLGLIIVTELINRFFLSRKLYIAHRTVNYAIVASVHRTSRFYTIFNHRFSLGMTESVSCLGFLVVTNGTFMFFCSCCSTGRCCNHVPITVSVTVCGDRGYICLIATS